MRACPEQISHFAQAEATDEEARSGFLSEESKERRLQASALQITGAHGSGDSRGGGAAQDGCGVELAHMVSQILKETLNPQLRIRVLL